jgi:primosomal protein N' (replication factor Y)
MPDPTGMWASVALARPFPEPLTYAIPAWMSDRLTVGHVVLVPLGKVAETGYVVGRLSEPGFDPAKVRPISRLVDPLPAFDEEQLDFFRWIARYYLAPLGMVIRTAIPSEVTAKVVRALQPTEEGVEALTRHEVAGGAAVVLREIIAHPGLTARGLARRLEDDLEDKEVLRAAESVVHSGWAVWGEKEVSGPKGVVRTISLATPTAEAALQRLPQAGARMKAILRMLADRGGSMDLGALVAEHGASSRGTVRRMVELGALKEGERENRDALEDVPAQGASNPPVLNADQRAALDVLTAPEADGAHLLWGVTGSGKTEVFLGAARAALDRGKQVCVLVPEIGLTPQLVGRFKARFGDEVAVLHSGLTAADRLAHWRRIRAGEARVAVGARSALFAPFRSLGLIVVDEEHDDSYKQDDGVKYNARDLAVVLGRRWSCPVVLASATPALETWFNAEQGRYRMLRLPHRATPRPVPVVELVDMTELPKPESGPSPVFSPQVVEALWRTFDAGGKAIVLYNRRGFATLVQCGSCGGTYECPNCGISMTLHLGARVVSCHYCGLTRPYDSRCPACLAPGLEELGKGTERVAEAFAEQFPDVPMARMDADTTSVRGSHHRILEAFRTGETRALVGTQIVAKGHDFPDVHTAVVVSADQGFRMPDFRAAERTYALLVQLAGRAGRGDVPGRVLVQTWTPDHYALQDLGDVETFLHRELRHRKVMRYPPFSRLVLVRLDGVDRATVREVATKLARELRQSLPRDGEIDVLGPSPAALPRMVGRWRFQLILRGDDVQRFRAWLGGVAGRLMGAGGGGVGGGVDVDPRHLM